jgi:hypothetical protein
VPIDIRVGVTEADDPKTEKLVRRCGEGAFRCWIRLKSYARLSRPDGHLTGMTGEDIEIASGWSGEPGLFCDTLVSIGQLESSGEAFSIRDWALMQPYADSSAARSEHARKAAHARWNRFALETPPDAPASSEHCSEHSRALLNGGSSNALSPSYLSSTDPSPSDRSPSSEEESTADAACASASSPPEPRNGTPKKTGSQSKPLTSWPEGFALDEEMRTFALERGIGADLEFEKFRDWAIGIDKHFSDWRAGWRNWIRKAVDFGRTEQQASALKRATANGTFDMIRRLQGETKGH